MGRDGKRTVRSLAALPRTHTAATPLLWKERIRDTRLANNLDTLPPSSTSLHQQSLLYQSSRAASCYRLWPCFFALPPWTLRANARVLVMTVERTHRARQPRQRLPSNISAPRFNSQPLPVNEPPSLHFLLRLLRSSSRGACVSSPVRTCASSRVLFWCSQVPSRYRGTSMYDRSLMPSLSLIAALPPFRIPLLFRVLDQGTTTEKGYIGTLVQQHACRSQSPQSPVTRLCTSCIPKVAAAASLRAHD